jgi:hypothetical protein
VTATVIGCMFAAVALVMGTFVATDEGPLGARLRSLGRTLTEAAAVTSAYAALFSFGVAVGCGLLYLADRLIGGR